MKLNVFNEYTKPKNESVHNVKPRIVIAKKGAITLNGQACTLIGLKPGDKVSLGHEENEPRNWYVFRDNENGYPVRACTGTVKGVIFNHARLASEFREVAELSDNETHSLLIAKSPTIVDNGDFGKIEYWGIIINP